MYTKEGVVLFIYLHKNMKQHGVTRDDEKTTTKQTRTQ